MSFDRSQSSSTGFSHPDRAPARQRRRYPSDLSDRQWSRVASLLPADSTTGRKRQFALRDVVDALSYRWTTACPWRMLPHDFPAWTSVYRYFNAWHRQGLITPIRNAIKIGRH